jgi:hypothetical protein
MTDFLHDTGGEAPPPSSALLSAIDGMKPVRTRVPGRTLLAFAGLALVVLLLSVGVGGMRKDLSGLPAAWVVSMTLAWATAATLSLVVALLPARGEVLANTARAGRVALTSTAALVALGFFATVDAPGRTIIPDHAFGGATWHCLFTGLKVTTAVLILAIVLLRRAFPSGGMRIAAALGAAGGAVGGLMLHLTCSFGGGLHVGIAHAGGMVLGMVLGAVVVARFLRT